VSKKGIVMSFMKKYIPMGILLLAAVILTINSAQAYGPNKYTVTVKGKLIYQDQRPDDKTPFPLPNGGFGFRGAANVTYKIFVLYPVLAGFVPSAKVNLPPLKGAKYIGGGIVGWDGQYQTKIVFFSNFLNNWMDIDLPIYIRFDLENTKFHVKNHKDKVYSAYTKFIWFNPSDGGTVSFGTQNPIANTKFNKAMHVFASINEAWNYGAVNGWNQGEALPVVWPNYKLNDDGDIDRDANGNPKHGGSNATADRIKLKEKIWDSPQTPYHEYGHVVDKRTGDLNSGGYEWPYSCMLESYNTAWSEDKGCWHSAKGHEDKNVAMTEGWANFYRFAVADHVIPEFNNNQFAWPGSENRCVNPYDDENEMNAAAVLVDLMDRNVDSHGLTKEDFQLKEKNNDDGTQWYYYDIQNQKMPAGADTINWNFSGLLSLLKDLGASSDISAYKDGTVTVNGIKEYMVELVNKCKAYNWQCKQWQELFIDLANTSWVNLEEDTAPNPYEWTKGTGPPSGYPY